MNRIDRLIHTFNSFHISYEYKNMFFVFAQHNALSSWRRRFPLDVIDICSIELHTDLYTDFSFSCCYFKHTLLSIVTFNTTVKPKQGIDKSSGLALQSLSLFRLIPKFIHSSRTCPSGCVGCTRVTVLRAAKSNSYRRTTDLNLM